MTVGCATFGGWHQQVKISTDVDQAQIMEGGHVLGTAPTFLRVKRSVGKDLVLSAEGQSKKLYLNGKYRWAESFAPNLVATIFWGYWGLLGLGLDFLTGAAWEYEKPSQVLFLGEQKLKPLRPRSISIAPPVFYDEIMSDELANELWPLLQERYPQSHISSYDQQLAIYASFDTNHKGLVSSRFRDELFQELGGSHLAVSYVERKDELLHLQVGIYDVLREQYVDKFDAEVAAKELASSRGTFWSVGRSAVVSVLPNSLGLESLNQTYLAPVSLRNEADSGSASIKRVDSTGIYGSTFSITASNVRSRKTRPFFAFQVRLVPSVSFESEKLQSTYTNLNGNWIDDWNMYRLGLGIGPEVGLYTPLGYYYLNFIPEGSGYWVSGPVTENVWDWTSSVQFGSSFFISDRFHMRVFGSWVQYSGKVSNTILGYQSNLSSIPPISTFSTGIAVEYVFPEGRKRVTRFFQ